jgi:ribosomal protein L13
MGKHLPTYEPSIDHGDNVVVINCEHIKFYGNRALTKTYKRHSGYAGGFKSMPAWKLLQKNPCEVIRKAVTGMLPNNLMRKRRLRRLHLFVGSNHPHTWRFPDLPDHTLMKDYSEEEVKEIIDGAKEEDWKSFDQMPDGVVFGRGQEDMDYDEYVAKYHKLGVPWDTFMPGTFKDKEREFREKYELDKEEEFLDFADLAWEQDEEEEEGEDEPKDQ